MKVLYATDGSEPARAGERMITALFDPDKVEIRTFTVAPETAYLPSSVDPGLEGTRLDLPPTHPEETARESAEHLEREGFKADASSSKGNPAMEILSLLRADKHDLVVLGAGHGSWLGHVLLGSVSMHVLHHAPCPVLITHREPIGTGRVLIGLDGSDQALRSARFAMQILDEERCSVTVATAVGEPWLSIGIYPPGPPFGGLPEYEAAQERQMAAAWNLVRRGAQQLQRSGFLADAEVLAGAAGSQLLKEGENLAVDLIVVGSRGLGPVKRSILGSVSDQVVRHGPAALVGRFTDASS